MVDSQFLVLQLPSMKQEEACVGHTGCRAEDGNLLVREGHDSVNARVPVFVSERNKEVYMPRQCIFMYFYYGLFVQVERTLVRASHRDAFVSAYVILFDQWSFVSCSLSTEKSN